MNRLLNPPFAHRPSSRLNINARILGIVIVVLSVGGLLFDLLSLSVLALPASLLTAYGIGNAALYGLASGIAFVANIISLIGGWRLARRHTDGKAWVVWSLGLAVIAGLASTPGESLGVGVASLALTLVFVAILYYLVVISHFSGEEPS